MSKGLRNRRRDYVEKRDEFMAAKVKEYWFIDRFERTMTVFKMRSGRIIRRVIREDQNYRTKLLPGFELPLRRLLALADEWAKKRGA